MMTQPLHRFHQTREVAVPRKHIIILSLLVILPLLAFFALGWRLVQNDQARTRQQFEDLLQASLADASRTIASYFDELEQRLLLLEIEPDNPESIQAQMRSEPLFEQIFVLDQDGLVVYPDADRSQSEAAYLSRIEQLIIDKNILRQWNNQQRPDQNSFTQNQGLSASNSSMNLNLGNRPVRVTVKNGDIQNVSQRIVVDAQRNTNTALGGNYYPPNGNVTGSPNHGWYTWYWGKGVQLIHWRGLDDGRILAIGIQRARWMADVLALLPESNSDTQTRAAPAQIRLVNSQGLPVYLWGTKQLADKATPTISLHLSQPLRSWQLQHFGPSTPFELGTSGTLINLLAAGGVLTVGLLLMAVYLSREVSRQTRDARQRVNFVNQVSHELKTPLTNIRMYAELLEQDLQLLDAEENERASSHLAVITSESGRLSRMINNVLTFAKMKRASKHVRQQTGSVDAVIRDVVAQFQPSLEKLGIDVTLDLDADRQVRLDVDAFEQMLGNLINNVEKYAANGKHVRIASRLKQQFARVDVSDAGAGIPASFAKRIFEPFERASDHIESATGTGIGLAITRGLAQSHGGDLELLESSIGAAFRLTLFVGNGPSEVAT